MYKKTKWQETSVKSNGGQWVLGESIEDKLRRVRISKETIKDTSPKIYTARKDGVIPAYDIRSDKFDVALDLTTKVTERRIAAREKSIGEQAKDGMKKEGGEAGGQSV